MIALQGVHLVVMQKALGFRINDEYGRDAVRLGSVVVLASTPQNRRHDVCCAGLSSFAMRRQRAVEHEVGHEVAVY